MPFSYPTHTATRNISNGFAVDLSSLLAACVYTFAHFTQSLSFFSVVCLFDLFGINTKICMRNFNQTNGKLCEKWKSFLFKWRFSNLLLNYECRMMDWLFSLCIFLLSKLIETDNRQKVSKSFQFISFEIQKCGRRARLITFNLPQIELKIFVRKMPKCCCS